MVERVQNISKPFAWRFFMNRSYSGIGSRQCPEDLKPKIKLLVELLNNKEFVLRSGGADGADMFFEEYANKKEIFLPWPNFNGNNSQLNDVCERAMKLASKFHPAWNKLKHGAKKLIARNGYQVLGKSLNDPVEFVLCWTPDGKVIGGTAQAIKIANYCHIPVFNLYNDFEGAIAHIEEL